MKSHHELLPGVTAAPTPPAVVVQSRRIIRRARLHAALRDVANLLLLIGVDWLFVHWPSTHVPLLSRHDSLNLLIGIHLVVLGYIWFARRWPHWRARRVAATWCAAERSRFTTTAVRKRRA